MTDDKCEIINLNKLLSLLPYTATAFHLDKIHVFLCVTHIISFLDIFQKLNLFFVLLNYHGSNNKNFRARCCSFESQRITKVEKDDVEEYKQQGKLGNSS